MLLATHDSHFCNNLFKTYKGRRSALGDASPSELISRHLILVFFSGSGPDSKKSAPPNHYFDRMQGGGSEMGAGGPPGMVTNEVSPIQYALVRQKS